MKLKVKTLQKSVDAEIEVDPSETILQVKQKIHEKFSNMPAESQKLIHSGKILSDEKTVAENDKIKDGDTLVVMVTKQKPAAASPPTGADATAASSGQAAAPPASTVPASQPPAGGEAAPPAGGAAPPATTAAPAPASDAPATPATGASALVTGTQLEEAVNNIVAMGFERSQVMAAMRAAFNNPDRAVEYLMTGIPMQQGPPAGGAPPGGEGTPAGGGDVPMGGDTPPTGGAGGGGGGGDDPLAALRQHPQFAQLRQMVQTNPQMLQTVLGVIGQQNPQLLQTITENQEAFLEMLREGVPEGGMGGGGGGGPPGSTVIRLTQEEAEAVARLEGLGFDRHIALEAYLACDKDENLAANYLFENAGDFMDEGDGGGNGPGGAPGGEGGDGQ